MPTDQKKHAQSISRAQALVSDWIIPDATSQHNHLSQLLSLVGAADISDRGELSLEVDSSLLPPAQKVAYDLLRKYKVLVDPSTLSESVVTRLRARKNYPRGEEKTTLREWGDAVLGYGEQVSFFLPCTLRRNTQLGTVQRMSQRASDFINSLSASVQPKTIESAHGEQEEEQVAIGLDEEITSSFQAEMDVAMDAGYGGLQLLDSLKQQAEQRWSPVVQACINELVQSGAMGDELEMMVRLLDRLDQTRSGPTSPI
ncbi:hypothetical protein PMI38_00672 [Pseudomonas sp. GM84]|jgi:hypothetical protein|uniref:hypothetical protein n=1 Tax=Pseudomonas sp. GM84 TaxID=1144340 RepID=UPI00026FAD20|nr:hypothetical protein [Pseudomonas sp. GM84]EJN39825.1 hypothetical protein PMI38_00672 [Pseudomonas sp. GM84]